jgi:hypothetical protein
VNKDIQESIVLISGYNWHSDEIGGYRRLYMYQHMFVVLLLFYNTVLLNIHASAEDKIDDP